MIPKALGIPGPCTVQRTHRLGRYNPDRKGARQVIVCYLNYADKNTSMQKFRTNRELCIEGHDLLLFSDYSQEVTKKRKEFTGLCAALHQKQIRFMLLYPATLIVTLPNGEQKTFTDPEETARHLDDPNQEDLTHMTPQAQ